MSVSEGRPGEGRAVASGIMAEAGAMVPTSDSDLTGLSKVSVLQLLRMGNRGRERVKKAASSVIGRSLVLPARCLRQLATQRLSLIHI